MDNLYTVMNVCIAYPCLLKNRQIFSVRISETLSLNNLLQSVRELQGKVTKNVSQYATLGGVLSMKICRRKVQKNKIFLQ